MKMEKIKERNIIKFLFLNAVTFGIYSIIYFYKAGRDIDAVCEGDGKKSFSYLVALVLSPVTFGLSKLFWNYQQGQRLKVNAPRYGYKMVPGGVDYAVFGILPLGGDLIVAYLMAEHLNRISRVFNTNGVASITEALAPADVF